MMISALESKPFPVHVLIFVRTRFTQKKKMHSFTHCDPIRRLWTDIQALHVQRVLFIVLALFKLRGQPEHLQRGNINFNF